MYLLNPIKGLTLAAALAASTPARASGQIYNWTTIAGSAGGNTDGTDGSALFYRPRGVVADTNGNLYVADTSNYTIRKITPSGSNWVVTTIAGQAGSSGSADGTNGAARFYYPCGLAVGSSGSIFVMDRYTIRKITQSGSDWVVTTVAGQAGSSGSADGSDGAAKFGGYGDIAVDGNSSLYVADPYNCNIRKVSPMGTHWVVNTIAGLAGTSGSTDGTNNTARFNSPNGIAVDGLGSLYVADTDNETIRKVTPVGTNWVVTTIAGQTGTNGSANGTNNASQFFYPQSVSVDNSGSLYVADAGNYTIRKLTPAGTNWVVTTVAGLASYTGSADGTNSTARFYGPDGIAADLTGSIYVTDNNMVRKVTPAGANWVVSTLAGVPSMGNSDGTNSFARFNAPYSLAVDIAKNVYVADENNGSVRRVAPVGTNWVVNTLVTGLSRIRGIAVDINSNLYLGLNLEAVISKLAPVGSTWQLTTIAGHGPGYADGTNRTAGFLDPRGLGVDSSGNVYVVDQAANTVRKLTPLGTNWVVTTIAGHPGVWGTNDGIGTNALFGYPSGVVADAGGNLYVADQYNYTIRKLTLVGTNWVVTTIAGSPGSYRAGGLDGTNSAARFDSPAGLALDGGGNLYVADWGGKIRKVTPMGTNWVVTTVGGSSVVGYTDGINARFFSPNGVAVDAQGNLFVADMDNNNIRQGVALPVFHPPMQANGAFNLAWSAVPGQTFQVQFKTNLAQSDWLNLGGPVTGTNGGAAVFDSPSSDPERFYRVVLLP